MSSSIDIAVVFGSLIPRLATHTKQVAEKYEHELLESVRVLHTESRVSLEDYEIIWSWLLNHSVRPSFDDLTNLKQLAGAVDPSPDDWFDSWCLNTVASADNPFIPGITLSVLLSEGAERASEGDRRIMLSLHEKVNTLLLEVLERLPNTVRGFPGGMEGCSAMFEPEGQTQDPRYLPGPLREMLQKRRQMEVFCSAPLVMDFLSLVFKKGLPDLRDTNNLRANGNELRYLCGSGHESLVLNQSRIRDGSDDGFHLGCFLQGTQPTIGKSDLLPGKATTVLPGVQFIAAGVVAKPCSYYHVPALRMVLDFLVYAGMLVFFCVLVLLFEEGEAINEEEAVVYEQAAITWQEIAFAVYTSVSPATTTSYSGRHRSRVRIFISASVRYIHRRGNLC